MTIPPSSPARRARPTASVDTLPYFAVAAPGLEPLVLAELQGIRVAGARLETGGVAFGGGDEALYRANLWLRTASRVVLRIARFHADTFHELERNARKVEWERFVAPGTPVRFRVTCRKSRLYHTDAVAERVAEAVAYRVKGDVSVVGGGHESDDEGDADDGTAQLFVVRITNDECVISVDGSGTLLHRRGYRQAIAKAPLRETLAAAALLGAGWTPESPLLDPMCGSGTIVIEAAMMARDIAPGLGRDFAFTHWPSFDAARWTRKLDEAAGRVRSTTAAPIVGSDRDEGAIEAARSNAVRAGVADDVTLAVRPVSALEAPAGATGFVVSNPPYGVRVGEQGALRNLYASLGNTLRERCPGWRLALVSADRVLEGQVGVAFTDEIRTSNGGIPVRLVAGTVDPEARRASEPAKERAPRGAGRPARKSARGSGAAADPATPAEGTEGEGYEYL